jgi:hypothetical protein
MSTLTAGAADSPGARLRHTARAKPFHRQLDVLGGIARGESYARRGIELVETDHRAAAAALEVSVGPRMRVRSGVIAPNPVVAGDLVREAILVEPVEHAIYRHAVYAEHAIDALTDFVVRKGVLGCEQDREHGNTRPRHSRAGIADHGFGVGLAGGWHGAD